MARRSLRDSDHRLTSQVDTRSSDWAVCGDAAIVLLCPEPVESIPETIVEATLYVVGKPLIQIYSIAGKVLEEDHVVGVIKYRKGKLPGLEN